MKDCQKFRLLHLKTNKTRTFRWPPYTGRVTFFSRAGKNRRNGIGTEGQRQPGDSSAGINCRKRRNEQSMRLAEPMVFILETNSPRPSITHTHTHTNTWPESQLQRTLLVITVMRSVKTLGIR